MPEQNIATLNFPRVVTTTTQTTLKSEYRHSHDSDNGNKQIVEQYITLNSDAVSQVDTITIALGTTGNTYAVSVTSGSDTKTYRYRQVDGDTANSITAFLATLIDTNPAVQAVANNTVITVSGVVPGAAYTLSNTDTTVPGNVTLVNTTAASGTAKHRKRWQITLTFSVKPNGYETVSVEGACYDGAETPSVVQRFGPLALSDAPRSLSQIQSAQGV